MDIDYTINDGSGYVFPGLVEDSFERNKGENSWNWFFPNANLDEIRRLDYISLLSLNDDECTNFLTKIIMEYADDLKNGLNYKDHIFNRFYFKKFHIRERIRDPKNSDNEQIRYYYYELSDYGTKAKQFDDRILAISAYTSKGDKVVFEGCWQIFAAHAAFIFMDIMAKDNKLDDEGLDKCIPMYYYNPLFMDNTEKYDLYLKYSHDGLRKVLMEDSKLNGNDPTNLYHLHLINKSIKLFYDFFSQALTRFVAFNHYMLNKVEEEQEVSMDNFETSGTIVECVKSRAYMDKKIRINLDRDYDIKLNINPKRRNIYSHNNKIIRRLCDYKFQVCAHWHSYWYGPKNKPKERHKERKWVEAYYKNEDNEFNIIKEKYKEKGE